MQRTQVKINWVTKRSVRCGKLKLGAVNVCNQAGGARSDEAEAEAERSRGKWEAEVHLNLFQIPLPFPRVTTSLPLGNRYPSTFSLSHPNHASTSVFSLFPHLVTLISQILYFASSFLAQLLSHHLNWSFCL